MNRRCLQAGMLAMLCFIVYSAAIAEQNSEVIEQFEKGHINWATGMFMSNGVGTPPEKSNEKDSEKLQIALNHARANALRHMLEIVLHTRVDSLNRVSSIAAESDMIMAKVESLVKGAKATKQVYLSDGTAQITMQMSMHGGFAQFVLPEEIKQIEPIITVNKGNNAADELPGNPNKDAVEAAEVFTGLVVDARGVKFTPTMVPVIVDEKGREVYGPAFASREFAVQQGMCGYSRDIKAANQNPRVIGNPLTVKGLQTADKLPATIIISNADATKIKSASEHLSFLKKCRVMIVVD